MEIKEILQKSSPKRSCRNGIHSLLRRADARESADLICCIYCTRSYKSVVLPISLTW